MNTERIKELALQAGFADFTVHNRIESKEEVLQKFAQLIAAEEREACAIEADKWQNSIHDPKYECDCATAIRARGNE
jgi:hypothetical protein